MLRSVLPIITGAHGVADNKPASPAHAYDFVDLANLNIDDTGNFNLTPYGGHSVVGGAVQYSSSPTPYMADSPGGIVSDKFTAIVKCRLSGVGSGEHFDVFDFVPSSGSGRLGLRLSDHSDTGYVRVQVMQSASAFDISERVGHYPAKGAWMFFAVAWSTAPGPVFVQLNHKALTLTQPPDPLMLHSGDWDLRINGANSVLGNLIGEIDHMQIWNDQLSTAEIDWVYGGGSMHYHSF